ncbi:hypothetical protein F5Y16DRAFT_404534 [Xylariaceae sp. FL0255]|nr:hypothetical protein F5Y16DRAFT_404534 [Xylariaceae sp. FL0255]
MWRRLFDNIQFTTNKSFILESIYHNPVLKQLGYSQTSGGVKQYAGDLCAKHKTARGYNVFIHKFPNGWFTYEYDSLLHISYYGDGWDTENLNSIFAHESSHVFRAMDEYGSCGCGGRGKYKVKNGNCKNCTKNQEKCLMVNNALQMCDWSKGQLGWIPRQGLYTFYKGNDGDSTTLRYRVFDGVKWWTNRKVPYTTLDKTDELNYNVFDGGNWASDVAVPQTGISTGPCAVVNGNKIYCFHQGANNDQQLWYNVLDGKSWAGNKLVSKGAMMSGGPSVVFSNNKIFCFHQGANNDNSMWYSVFDGKSWRAMSQSLRRVYPKRRRPLYKTKIYVFHQGSHYSNSLRYNIFDGTNWAGDNAVPSTILTGAPSAMVYGANLYCMYSGRGNRSGQLYYNVFTGSSWVGSKNVSGQAEMSASPVGHLYLSREIAF